MENQVHGNKCFPNLVDFFQHLEKLAFPPAVQQEQAGAGGTHPGEDRDTEGLRESRKPLMHAPFWHPEANQAANVLKGHRQLATRKW